MLLGLVHVIDAEPSKIISQLLSSQTLVLIVQTSCFEENEYIDKEECPHKSRVNINLTLDERTMSHVLSSTIHILSVKS